MLQVTKLRKEFSQGGYTVVAVKDVSFTVETGEFASIIGRSGSGKSTLLGLLGALDSPTSGSIEIDGRDIAKLRDHKLIEYRRSAIGFVFQNYNLVPNLTAIENVMLPLEYNGVSKDKRMKRAVKLLNQVGITSDKQKRKPGKLSGGEQQRVSIARALANQPKLILADEPTGNLDSENGRLIFDLLHDLSKSENTTIVVVTHDLEIAGQTDKTFHLQDGQLQIKTNEKGGK
jgi:putative ABC transport system ATP-binding protein